MPNIKEKRFFDYLGRKLNKVVYVANDLPEIGAWYAIDYLEYCREEMSKTSFSDVSSRDTLREYQKLLTPHILPDYNSYLPSPRKLTFRGREKFWLNIASHTECLIMHQQHKFVVDSYDFRIDAFVYKANDPRKGVAIEHDGAYHNSERQQIFDEERDQILNSHGIPVVRIFDDLNQLSWPYEAILDYFNLPGASKKTPAWNYSN